MADKKISALTAATTPLAGTEVLPIVQGGATVKVSVDNLTSGKIVNASGLQIGDLGVTDATFQGRIKLEDASTSLQSVGGLEFVTSSFGSGYGWKINSIDSAGAQLVFGSRQNSVNWTETVRLDSNGRVGINETAPDYRLDVNGTFGFAPGSSVTPVDNGDVVFELTNNTTLTVRAKGSDGTVRSATIILV